MTDERSVDTSELGSAASAISRGTPVDWDAIAAEVSADDSGVFEELKTLEALSQLNTPVPAMWGPFMICSEIGRGSFGVVYRAIDATLEVELALKVIKPKSGTVLDRGRALREARSLAHIVHPNIVRIYRAEQIDDEVGVAMELVTGTTLATLVRQQGPFSAREAMLIGVDLSRALAAVHGESVVHGDIKARNVMRAEGGRTVLMDFGSARDLRRDEEDDGHPTTGTPLYIAPEVFAGGPPTKASDIYSLGVLLYFLTTGAYPVGGTTASDVERRHAEGARRKPLRDVRPDLPHAFIQVVDRALAQKPEDRHQSAGELESDLTKALGAGPRPVPAPVPRAWRTGLIAALLIAAAAIAWLLLRDQFTPVDNRQATAQPTVAGTPTTAPVSSATDEYRIHATLYREHDSQEVPLADGGRVFPADNLSLRVTATVPIHIYVVNEDDNGESWLIYPLDAEGAMTPLSAAQRHRLPTPPGRDQISWTVTSRGGREHFLLFASTKPPSPAFAKIFANLPRPQAGRPVNYQRVSGQTLQMLRGIGGLTSTGNRSGADTSLLKEFTIPLAPGEETVRGIWVRQLTLDNP